MARPFLVERVPLPPALMDLPVYVFWFLSVLWLCPSFLCASLSFLSLLVEALRFLISPLVCSLSLLYAVSLFTLFCLIMFIPLHFGSKQSTEGRGTTVLSASSVDYPLLQ